VPNELGTLIAAEVTRAEADFQGGRTKALTIVGISGGLVTLTTGFLGVAAGGNKDFLKSGDRWALVFAFAAFVAAAILALVTNLPSAVTLAKARELKPLVTDHWDADGWDQRVAELYVEYLISLRAVNSRTATLLTAAIGAEIAGIFFTAVMAFLALSHL
jgi:hypothetical protein